MHRYQRDPVAGPGAVAKLGALPGQGEAKEQRVIELPAGLDFDPLATRVGEILVGESLAVETDLVVEIKAEQGDVQIERPASHARTDFVAVALLRLEVAREHRGEGLRIEAEQLVGVGEAEDATGAQVQPERLACLPRQAQLVCIARARGLSRQRRLAVGRALVHLLPPKAQAELERRRQPGRVLDVDRATDLPAGLSVDAGEAAVGVRFHFGVVPVEADHGLARPRHQSVLPAQPRRQKHRVAVAIGAERRRFVGRLPVLDAAFDGQFERLAEAMAEAGPHTIALAAAAVVRRARKGRARAKVRFGDRTRLAGAVAEGCEIDEQFAVVVEKPAQAGVGGTAVGVVVVAPAFGLGPGGRGLVTERAAATPSRQRDVAVVVAAGADLGVGIGAGRLVGDDVDDTADRAIAVKDRAAAADDLDAFDRLARNRRPVDAAGVDGIEPHAVDQHQRVAGRRVAEAAHVDGRVEPERAVQRTAVDAGPALEQIRNRYRRTERDLATIDHRDVGRCGVLVVGEARCGDDHRFRALWFRGVGRRHDEDCGERRAVEAKMQH